MDSKDSNVFAWVMFWYAVSAILLMSLPLLMPQSWRSFHVVEIGSKVGEALVIAVFLALTVDVFVKKRLANEVVKDVTPFIPGHNLPVEIRNELREIYAINQYRKAEIRLTLQELENEPVFIGVTIYLDYTVFNLTEDLLNHTHHIIVKEAYKPKQPIKHILSVSASGVRASEKSNIHASGDYDIKAQSDDDLGTEDRENEYRIWSREVLISPHGSGRFESKIHYILPIDSEETMISVLTTVGVVIRIES